MTCDDVRDLIARCPLWTYTRVGLGSRRLELLPDGHVGEGAAGVEHRWQVDVDGWLHLIDESGRTTVRLAAVPPKEESDWHFIGRWLFYEKGEVRLDPVWPVPTEVPGTRTLRSYWDEQEVRGLTEEESRIERELAGRSFYFQVAGDGAPPTQRLTLFSIDKNWRVFVDQGHPVLLLAALGHEVALLRGVDGTWRSTREAVLLCPV